MGVGIDLPAWLAALENEVEQHHLPRRLREQSFNEQQGETDTLPIAKLRQQLEELPNRDGSY
jgi:hypothetical protein